MINLCHPATNVLTTSWCESKCSKPSQFYNLAALYSKFFIHPAKNNGKKQVAISFTVRPVAIELSHLNSYTLKTAVEPALLQGGLNERSSTCAQFTYLFGGERTYWGMWANQSARVNATTCCCLGGGEYRGLWIKNKLTLLLSISLRTPPPPPYQRAPMTTTTIRYLLLMHGGLTVNVFGIALIQSSAKF